MPVISDSALVVCVDDWGKYLVSQGLMVAVSIFFPELPVDLMDKVPTVRSVGIFTVFLSFISSLSLQTVQPTLILPARRTF